MEYVWGDNKSMIDSSTIPESKLNKRHNILSFHYVRSMISRGYINLRHIASEWNFSDILTKNWSYQSSYHELIQPVFHHSGNTAALFLDDTLELDVAIEEGTIFGIQVGSEKRSSIPMPGTLHTRFANSLLDVSPHQLEDSLLLHHTFLGP